MRVLLALVLAGVPVSLAATTLVVFRVDGRVILATDSAAVRLDEKGRDHITVGCKIRESGKWWLLNGGYFAPDVVADRIAAASTLADALAALHHSDLRDRVIANKDLWSGRPAGSPLTTVVIAGPDLTLGVFMIFLKTVTPFEAIAESDTCPGRLCPTDGYYLVGEPGDAPQNPLLQSPASVVSTGGCGGGATVHQRTDRVHATTREATDRCVGDYDGGCTMGWA